MRRQQSPNRPHTRYHDNNFKWMVQCIGIQLKNLMQLPLRKFCIRKADINMQHDYFNANNFSKYYISCATSLSRFKKVLIEMLLGCSWDAPRMLLGHFWDAPGMLLRRSWDTPGTLLGCSWDAPVMLLGHSWDAPWTLLGCYWDAPGTLLGRSWDAHGTLLGCSFSINYL